jgi:Zn-dependent protease with chaperone function
MVIKSDVPNAFALPGGRIIILDGILQAAETPDEIAGVLVHEMGHIAHHDAMGTLIESGGKGFVLGTVLGDLAGTSTTPIFFAGKALLQASYSGEAEAAADAYEIETMRVLGRSPVALGDLLTRLTASKGGAQPNLLDSHPPTPERLATLRSARVLTTGLPILNEFEFKALKHICDD